MRIAGLGAAAAAEPMRTSAAAHRPTVSRARHTRPLRRALFKNCSVLARTSGAILAPSARKVRAVLVAEILELQRNLGALAQQGDGRLELIALLAGHAQLIAADLRLYLQLGVFQARHEFLRLGCLDALLDAHGAARLRQ